MQFRTAILIGLIPLACASRAPGQFIVAGNHPDSSSFTIAPSDTVFQAQTFTPSTTGQLTLVNLPFFTSSPTTDITVKITTADPTTGLPGSTTLATVSLPPDQVAFSTFSSPVYTTFDFSSAGVTLTAGTRYSLVISTTSPDFAYFVLTSSDTYAGGQAFQSLDSGATYAPLNSKSLDWAFDVQEIPEPTHILVPILVAVCIPRRRCQLSIIHCQLLPCPLRQLHSDRVTPRPQDQ